MGRFGLGDGSGDLKMWLVVGDIEEEEEMVFGDGLNVKWEGGRS